VGAPDASADALAVARANLAGVGGKVGRRVHLCEGEWYGALPDELRGQVNVIVSNPPYVADSEALPPEVRDWEPASALYAGPDGTECLKAIVAGAGEWLNRPGALVLEIAPHQADAVRADCERAGFGHVEVCPDLAGRDRVVLARMR
jgi:release factor glutamine methyltransferase